MTELISLEDRVDCWVAHITTSQLLSKCRDVAIEQGALTGGKYLFRGGRVVVKYKKSGDIMVEADRRIVLEVRCLGTKLPRQSSAAVIRETDQGGTSFYQLLHYHAGKWEEKIGRLYAAKRQRDFR